MKLSGKQKILLLSGEEITVDFDEYNVSVKKLKVIGASYYTYMICIDDVEKEISGKAYDELVAGGVKEEK